MLIALAVPFGVSFHLFWAGSGSDLSFVDRERIGARYLSSLYPLLGALTDAETAALTGGAPPPALDAAVLQVAEDDKAFGGALGTTQRWQDLRGRIGALKSVSGNRSDQSTAYGEAINAALALIAQDGDSSNLILDPQLDSYYLIDTLLLRLPQMEADAAAAVAVTSQASAGSPTAGDGSVPVGAAQLYVALDRITTNATAVDTGLQKAFGNTASRTLGPDLLAPVDRFHIAVAALAPSSDLISLPPALQPTAAITASRAQVQAAITQLATAGIVELRHLLDARASAIGQRRLEAAVSAAIGVALVVLLSWSLLPKRVRDFDLDDADQTAAAAAPTVAEEVVALLDARELLKTGELQRIGRAVAARRDRDPNAGDDL